jgi:hypothetical protein
MTTEEESQHVSLDDALDAAMAQDASSDVSATEGTPALPSVPEGAVEPPAFELPAYTKRWNAEARTALEKLAAAQEHRPHLDPLLKQFDEANKFIGQRDNELGELRKRFEPLWETLAPYEKRYALQGMTLQQGLGQLLQAAEFVSQSPDQAFPYFAQTYRPRDAARAVQEVARVWGVDLGAVAQDAPYIDPAVQSLVQPLQQELQHLRQWRDQQETHSRTAAQTALIEELRSFEAAVDDNGNPKHPYLRDVFDDMVRLAQSGYAKSIPEAYERACRLNDTISQRQAEEQQKAAEERARKDAAARTAAANKTADAAKTVTGKGTATRSAPMDLEEAMALAEAELSGKS